MKEPTNDSRAYAALKGLREWYVTKEERAMKFPRGDDISECIDDFLADLMHFLHIEGIAHDWEASVACAKRHFDAEIEEAKQ